MPLSFVEEPLELICSPGKSSLAVHIALREAELPFSLTLVDVDEHECRYASETVPDDWLSRVPLLVIGDSVYRETLAMLLYVESCSAPASFTVHETMQKLSWLSYIASTIHPAFSQIARPKRFAASDVSQDVRAGGMRNAKHAVRLIEASLFRGRAAVGEQFSVLDAYLVPAYRWAWRIGIDMAAECPAWTRWAHTVRSRRSVAESLVAERIDLLPAGVSKEEIQSALR